MTLLVFDTQRQEWLDLDALKPSVREAGAEPPLHPKLCGPCDECCNALADYVTIPAYAERLTGKPVAPLPHTCRDCGAHFKKGETEALCEHLILCSSYMNRVPVKDEQGNTLRMLGDPDPVKLARHVQLYGSEGAHAWLHLLDDPKAKTVNAVISRRSRRGSKSRMVRRPKRQKFVEKA